MRNDVVDFARGLALVAPVNLSPVISTPLEDPFLSTSITSDPSSLASFGELVQQHVDCVTSFSSASPSIISQAPDGDEDDIIVYLVEDLQSDSDSGWSEMDDSDSDGSLVDGSPRVKRPPPRGSSRFSSNPPPLPADDTVLNTFKAVALYKVAPSSRIFRTAAAGLSENKSAKASLLSTSTSRCLGTISEELEVDIEDTGAQPEDPPCKGRRKRGKRVPTATRRMRKRERMLAVAEESVPAGGSLHNETVPYPPAANADVVQVADAEALSDDLAPSEEVSLPAEVLWIWHPEPKICVECWTAIPS